MPDNVDNPVNTDANSGANDKIRDHIPPPPGPPPPVTFAGYTVGIAALVYIAHTIYVWIFCGC